MATEIVNQTKALNDVSRNLTKLTKAVEDMDRNMNRNLVKLVHTIEHTNNLELQRLRDIPISNQLHFEGDE